MEFIMLVGDVTIIAGIGGVIVGGNPEISKNDTSKLCKKGDTIIVISDDQEFTFNVKDIRLSYSISEQVIVSLQVEETENFSKIKLGASVFKNTK